MAEIIKPAVDAENLNEAGDVITEEIIITNDRGQSVDIRAFCMSVVLYEDIFSNVLKGEALITDSGNLIASVPFKGTEYLTIRYRTPSFKEVIGKTFYVYAVTDRAFTATDRQQGYVLHFMSVEGHIDNITTISKKYSDTSDKIITSVYNEYLRPKRFINRDGFSQFNASTNLSSKVSVVPTYWSPLKLINWVSSRSFKNGPEAPNFLFFESNKGFYFTSVEELIRKQLDADTLFAEYIYFPGAPTIQAEPNSKFKYTKPETTKLFSMVRNVKPFKLYDTIHGQDHGYYASTLLSVDPTLKRPISTDYDHYDVFKTFKHMEPNNKQTYPNTLVRVPSTYKTLLTKQYKLHNDFEDPKYQKWALQRNSLMHELHEIKLEIEVPGRTDIEIGKLVRFLYPKNIDKTLDVLSEDALDPYMSGIYMITAIRHQFLLNKHVMYIEMVKDSFSRDLK